MIGAIGPAVHSKKLGRSNAPHWSHWKQGMRIVLSEPSIDTYLTKVGVLLFIHNTTCVKSSPGVISYSSGDRGAIQ
jgi:hypothetical protein